MNTIPNRLSVEKATGHIIGENVSISYNSPFPCVNGSWGSRAMMGVVMHTMVGDLPGTISVFNDPSYKASAHFGIAQDGHIHQFGPIGQGWIAWAQEMGNPEWYSIEHADHGNPDNPLTDAQVISSAQLVECLSAFAGFPLQISDSVSTKGYGVHNMGGLAWGGHTCPDKPPHHVRSSQREDILNLSRQIRDGVATSGPYRHLASGVESLSDIAHRRGTTAAHLLDVSMKAYTAADTAVLLGQTLPKGTPYYTSNP